MVMNVVSGRRSPTLIVMGLSSRADPRVLGLDGATDLKGSRRTSQGCAHDIGGRLQPCLPGESRGARRSRYWTAAGADGKMQNHRRLIVLSGAGNRRFYADCPDGRTEKLLVSVPTGERANALQVTPLSSTSIGLRSTPLRSPG